MSIQSTIADAIQTSISENRIAEKIIVTRNIEEVLEWLEVENCTPLDWKQEQDGSYDLWGMREDEACWRIRITVRSLQWHLQQLDATTVLVDEEGKRWFPGHLLPLAAADVEKYTVDATGIWQLHRSGMRRPQPVFRFV